MMRIIRDEDGGTVMLVPVNDTEREALNGILGHFVSGGRLEYGGKARGSTDEDTVLEFNAGGVRELNGGEFVGGTNLLLRGTEGRDRAVVNTIRNMCYFGAGALFLVGESNQNGERALVCTGGFCRHCEHPIMGLSADSKVCDACAAKCKHEYRSSVGVGFGFSQVVALDICPYCHRASPDSIEQVKRLTVLERFSAAKQGMGADFFAIQNLGGVDVDELLEFQNTGKLPELFQPILDANPDLAPEFEALRQDLLAAH
jgi:hypothetical protein